MSIRALLVCAAAAFSLPAYAGTEPASGTAQPAEKAEAAEKAQPQAEERKVCRRIESSGRRTGSQKVCLTREEWTRLEREGR